MSKTDWNTLTSPAAEAMEPAGCQAADLRGLLNAIVTQISEADRRQSDSLHQLQDRLSVLGRDANSLRPRVPEQFQHAFERIEAGMAELASRIAQAQSEAQSAPAFAGTAARSEPDAHHPYGHVAHAAALRDSEPATAAAMPSAVAPLSPQTSELMGEPPVALRSAQSAAKRADAAAKPAPAFDNFDIIESLPGDVSDPWDDAAADALAKVYESEPQTFPQASYAVHANEPSRAYSPQPQPQPGTPDHGWLEKRFDELSHHIDASLAEIRPDQSFFAIGQRLDQFERSFEQAFENVATRNDVESVRLIEAHMVELVGHLESTHNQMARLEDIEAALGSIAGRLDEIHAMAAASSGDEPPQFAATAAEPLDIAAVARATAEEVAQRMADMPKTAAVIPGIDEMRHLIERSMSNARQSEENTTALLDTLQQAMIRLLDRVDAIEFNQHQAQAVAHSLAASQSLQSSVPDYDRREPHFDSRPAYADPVPAARSGEELDEAVAAVAHRNPAPSYGKQQPMSAGYESEFARSDARGPEAPAASGETRQPEKLRQDFIADARRAKMRLASENDEDAIVIPAPVREAPAPGGKAAAGPRASKPSTVTNPGEPAKAPAVSPRVVALSLALAVAGGAYLMLPSKGNRNTAAPATVSQAEVAEPAGKAKTETTVSKARGANDTADAPPPDADFTAPPSGSTQLNLHQTEGHIVPDDMTVGEAARPLSGIAVASNGDIDTASIARAHREQAMAKVSNRLGEVAASQSSIAEPAALDMSGGANPPQDALNVPAGSRSALDLPPATVGPLSLRLAAANGDPSAEFEVGARLAEGKGTDQNFKDAAKWYQRSASKGFAQAQYRLGTLYERGLGLKADEARAKEWYLRAAEQGNIKAMHNLAVLAANSRQGSPDYTTAARWFTGAAERGLADSQFNLAVLYENGLGVDADMRQSYKWLSLAARGGDKEAVRRRDIMKGKLTGEEVAEAEALVRGYRSMPADPMINDARKAGEAWKKNAGNGENG